MLRQTVYFNKFYLQSLFICFKIDSTTLLFLLSLLNKRYRMYACLFVCLSVWLVICLSVSLLKIYSANIVININAAKSLQKSRKESASRQKSSQTLDPGINKGIINSAYKECCSHQSKSNSTALFYLLSY